ncbi:uncharacterized protein LOC144147167 [Haemaphysalis longicornis]
MTIKVFLEATPLVVDLEFPEGIEQGGCLTIVLTSPGQKLVGEDKSGIQFSHVNNEIIPVVRTVTVEDDLAACIQTLQKVKIEAEPLPSGKLPCIVRLVPKVYSEKEAPPDLSFPPIGKVLDCLPGSPTMFPAGSPDQSGASSEQEDENDLNFQDPSALGVGGGPGGLQDLDDLSLAKDDLENADSPMPEGPAADPNILTCTVCDYTTESGDELRYHIRLHAVQGELCCKVCRQKYRTLADFKEHCDSHAAPAPPPRNAPVVTARAPRSPPSLFCGTCGKVFRSQAWLNRHIEKRHGGTDDADQEADSAEGSAPGRGPPTLQCCACARTFTSASLLQAHERSHFEGSAATEGGDYACGLCDRSFTSYRGLRMHQRKHLRENRWAEGGAGREEDAAAAAPVTTAVATVVDLSEADVSVIEQAYETVPAGEPFMEAPLTAMDAVFSDDVVSALRAVGMDCDEGTAEVVAAAAATMATASEPVAEASVADASHTKFPCPLCGKVFERALKRDHHVVRKHTKAYPLQCTMCRRGFMFQKNLDRHFQDSHSGHYMVNTVTVAPANPQNEAAAPGGGGGQLVRQFKCNYCAYTGATLSEIQAHLISHPEIRFFACEGCDKEFSSEVRYQRHVERGLCQQRPQCDECGKCLSSQTALRNHLLCHGQDRAFVCSQCGEAFKTATTLKYHQQARHGASRPFKCEHCSKGFNFLAQKKRHVSRVHLRQTNHACTLCPMRFMTKRELMLHLLCGHKFQPVVSDKGSALMPDGTSAPSLKLFACEHCTYVSYSRKGYLRHLVDHTGVWPYACDLCSKGFIERNQAERHIRTAHTSESYPCPRCPRVFVLPSSFDEHLQAHREQRGTACPQCDKYFETQGLYDLHLQAHSRELHYRCQTCGQGFNKIASLNFHAIVHKHERAGPNTWSHACEVCKKRFKYPGSLAAHRYRHAQDTVFKCDLCQVTLHSEGVFEAHMRRHRGEKPFQCPYCDKAFTLAMSRRHHITRFHTGDYRIFCPLCHKGVVSNKMLRRHLFHVHSTVLGGAGKRGGNKTDLLAAASSSPSSLLAPPVEGEEMMEDEAAAVQVLATADADGVVHLHTAGGPDDGLVGMGDDTPLTVTLPADALLLGAVESVQVQGIETVVETVQFQ